MAKTRNRTINSPSPTLGFGFAIYISSVLKNFTTFWYISFFMRIIVATPLLHRLLKLRKIMNIKGITWCWLY